MFQSNIMLWNQCTYMICGTLKHFCNSNKQTNKFYTFNENFPMKFYTYKKETRKKNLPHQSFQFKVRLWNLNYMILKCSLVHFGMIMMMIMIFKGWKIFFHWKFTWVNCFFNHLTKIRWSFEFLKKWNIIIK
jgi:hypothetical protein